MKAYSFRQMQDAGIRVDNYKANEREGVFIATLDVKRWGKGRNILAYFTFERAKNGNSYLRKVERYECLTP